MRLPSLDMHEKRPTCVRSTHVQCENAHVDHFDNSLLSLLSPRIYLPFLTLISPLVHGHGLDLSISHSLSLTPSYLLSPSFPLSIRSSFTPSSSLPPSVLPSLERALAREHKHTKYLKACKTSCLYVFLPLSEQSHECLRVLSSASLE